MKDLLPHYEQELILLRQRAAEFAARFPGPASRLQIVREDCGDPHVERMLQATALLTARVHKSLEDGYSRFTESLFEVLFPHYLRPFPSCAIVQVNPPANASSVTAIPRGTELHSAPVDGVSCRFRTSYDIRHLPVRLAHAAFSEFPDAPASVRIPEGCGARLTFGIDLTDGQDGFGSLANEVLRVYLDGEASLVAAVRDLLHGQVIAAYVEVEEAAWSPLPSVPLAPVGFADDEALVPFSARSHPAYRFLTEYFTFPEKFNFVDIDLGKIVSYLPDDCRHLTLHLLLPAIRPDSNETSLLSTLSPDNLLLGCTPVVNLFKRAAVPILMTHERADYPLLPDAEHLAAYDIHTVDAVRMLSRREQDPAVTAFRPFYALRHSEETGEQRRYYVVRRDETLGAGHEYQIAFVDADFDPAGCDQATMSVELTCTNRDLPSSIGTGDSEGGLQPPMGCAAGTTVAFALKPTAPRRFAATPALQWRLLSHLALNFHSLAQEGLDGFREMLSLYDLAQTPDTKRRIESVTALAHHPTTAWIRDERGATLVHGIEVRLTVDETGFVGSGVHLFARVIDRFLGLYVQINSFTQLVVLSARTGKELLRCQPRNGNLYLA